MSITDELRKWGRATLMPSLLVRMEAIADRIDAEHEEVVQREHETAYDAGYAEGVGVANAKDAQAEYLRGKNDGYDEGWDAGYASADDWLAQHEDAMAEHGWIRLPKDADGEYIQPSDIPRLTKANDGKRLVFFPSLELRQDGTWSLAGWTPDRYRISKPTVEDVLTEFGIDWEHESDCEDRAALLKEYAAKLRLAKEDV